MIFITLLLLKGDRVDYIANYKEKVEYFKKLGRPVPTLQMIKTEEQIQGIKEAGVLNNKILDAVADNIHIGMSTLEIDEIVYNKTKELGGIPATLGFEGYPKSCCTSINDQVCHGIPDARIILKEGDIINVDCTTIYKGYYADASRMFTMGVISEEAAKLVKVTKESLEQALKVLKPYCRLGDIGYAIEHHVKRNGCSVVHEIGGHGVGIDFHEDPYVAHYGKRDTGLVLFPGMVFTIEPMINLGTRRVFLDASNNWTIYTADGSWSAQVEHTVVITEDGFEILAD